MCGIAGIVARAGRPVALSDLELLGATLAHRGPDDEGFYRTARAGLVHRRLAIIDLSPAGHGPMCNEDQTIWLTYNGEIYNYRELIPELQAQGHRFASACDAEVVIHAYEQFGEDCVTRFNGMFAFALWDERQQTLFCARDRAGEKPLYFTEGAGGFAFASEIKALVRLPWVRRRVADMAVCDYLVHGSVDHTDHTFFQDIQVLPAAHTLTVRAASHELRRYWSLPLPFEGDPTIRPTRRQQARWANEFGALLFDSVRLRLRSDVTVGTCLSGGLDSSTIACMMNRLLFPEQSGPPQERWHARGEQQKTFSACYDDASVDERHYIEMVVRQTGADAYQTFPTGDDLLERIGAVVWHQDEPFLSTSIVAQWHVMQLARTQGVKVLLDGQGADELLCGYPGYFGPFFADLLVHGRGAELARELSLYNRYYGQRWGSGTQLMLRALRATHGWLRPQLRSRLDARRLTPAWIAPGLAETAATGWRDAAAETVSVPDGGYLSALQRQLFLHTSLPALLRYEDRNAMAFGVESRVPFLDHRLIEYAFSKPSMFFIRDGLSKRVLRQATRGLLPEAVRTRRDKIGFNTPEAAWFRGAAREPIQRLLASPSVALHGYLQPTVVRETCASFMAGAAVDTALIWRWVNLELWLRTFIDRPPPGSPPAPMSPFSTHAAVRHA